MGSLTLLVRIAERWAMGGKFGSGARGQFARASRWCVSRLRVWRGFARAGRRGRVAARRLLTKVALSRRVRRQADRDRGCLRARRNRLLARAETQKQVQRDESSILGAWRSLGKEVEEVDEVKEVKDRN